MSIKIKQQTDYLLTEVNLELPTDQSELHQFLKAMKATGKVVVIYNQGGVQGINVEQKTKMSVDEAHKIRSLLKIDNKVID